MPIRNYNGELRNFIPKLMGPATEGYASLRPCYLKDGVPSTYVVPGDWMKDIEKWDYPKTQFPKSNENTVQYFCATDGHNAGGLATYEAMRKAFDTAKGDGHFILLAGWSHDLSFALDGNPKARKGSLSTMAEIWAKKAKDKVKIRTLLWRPAWGSDVETTINPMAKTNAALLDALGVKPDENAFGNRGKLPPLAMGSSGQNGKETEYINTLNVDGSTPRLALGIWDGSLRDQVFPCHHQKILIVYGQEGLYGFFGGVDIYADRVIPDKDGAPQHDVHCRVIGKAAMQLLQLWIDRWNACREARDQEDASHWLDAARAPGTVSPSGPGQPCQQVQIGQTVGNPSIKYPSDGFDMLSHCIQNTKKFIYMQDQYFWSIDAVDELRAVLSRIEHLTIVLPDPSISSPLIAGTLLRRAAIAHLVEGLAPTDLKKVGIYCPSPAGDPGTYVHSKIWIFDDECAIVGSSNCNNRGYFSDSELMGRISEGSMRTWDDLDLNFAHKLRLDLWSHHLRKPKEALYDPSSVAYFRLQEDPCRIKDHVDRFGHWTDQSKWDNDSFQNKMELFVAWAGADQRP